MMTLLHSVCFQPMLLSVCRTHIPQIAAKGKYIKSTGLAGFAMWETAGDSHDILLDAINSAIGNTY